MTYGIIKVNKTVPVVHRLDWVKLVDYVKRYISINENIRFCDNDWVKKLDLSKGVSKIRGNFFVECLSLPETKEKYCTSFYEKNVFAQT